MKTKALFCALIVALLCMNSCGIMQNTTTSNSQAYTSGSNAGKALLALYTQYKADGKFEVTNISNITNLLVLSNSWEGIKTASKGSDFYKDFTKGIIAGSNNLVTTNNSTSVIDAISTAVTTIDNSNIGKNNNSQNTTTTTNTTTSGDVINTVTSLLGLLGGK